MFLCEKDVKYRVLREATLLVFDSPCIEFLWYYFLFFRHLLFFKPLQAKELTKLNFHKNAEGEFIPGEEISNIELYVSYILAA